jgi:hypothetical protein
VNAALEGARQRKEIGNALSAHVTIAAGDSLTGLCQMYRDDLPMLFITSEVTITRPQSADPAVTVTAGHRRESARAAGDTSRGGDERARPRRICTGARTR